MALHRLPTKPSEHETAQLSDLERQIQAVRFHDFACFEESHVSTENIVKTAIPIENRQLGRERYQDH